MFFQILAQEDNGFDSNTLWVVLVVLLIICAIVWLFRNLR